MSRFKQNPSFRAPPLIGAEDPYRALAEIGVGYGTTMSELHRACLDAQQRQLLSPERARAWAELRSTETRLLLDLLHLAPAGLTPEATGRADFAVGAAPLPGADALACAPPELLLRLAAELLGRREQPVIPESETPASLWGALAQHLSESEPNVGLDELPSLLPEDP
jgi:hypothetical protein